VVHLEEQAELKCGTWGAVGRDLLKQGVLAGWGPMQRERNGPRRRGAQPTAARAAASSQVVGPGQEVTADCRVTTHRARKHHVRECASFAWRKPPKRPLRWRRRARLLLARTGTLPRCANPELVSAPHPCYISLRLQSARKQPAGSQTKDRLLFRILSQKQKVDTSQRDYTHHRETTHSRAGSHPLFVGSAYPILNSLR
jgi:hypothetical protein